MEIQDPLTGLGAGFGSALADICCPVLCPDNKFGAGNGTALSDKRLFRFLRLFYFWTVTS